MAYRAALITGASSGIGAAFARALPPTTALILTGRDQAALSALQSELASAGRPVAIVIADLSTGEGCEAVATAGRAQPLDLLINNAGLGQFAGFLDTDAATIDAQMLVNVVAATRLTHRLAPHVMDTARTHGGRAGLIMVSSALALTPLPGMATYAASKAYLSSLSQALAQEWRDEPIDVLTLCPGPVRTQFGARAGYQGSDLPGAADPDAVARYALSIIGRQSVAGSGVLSSLALAPRFAADHLGAVATGLAARALRGRTGPSDQNA